MTTSRWCVFALLALLLPLQVLSQELDLLDALDDDAVKSPTPPPKPAVPEGGPPAAGTPAPKPALPAGGAAAGTKAPFKPKPKPDNADFELSDALDDNLGGKDKNKGQQGGTGGFSDSDLFDVSKDDTYKPDKGKGGRHSDSDHTEQYDNNNETTAEIGTIAGIVSAVAMALVGAISSYISYQKKKLCFSIQQSLNTDMVKAENPEAVVATEPQAQQTLLEPPNAEPPTDENAV